MEKYLADRSYALIYRMYAKCKYFPAGSMPRVSPGSMSRTSLKCWCNVCNRVWQIFWICFCRECATKPVARAFLSLPGSAGRARTRGRSALSPAAFPVRPRGAGPDSHNARGLLLSRFRRVAGSETEHCGSFGCRTGPEYRLLSGRSGSRPAPSHRLVDRQRRHPYSVRTDTAIIYSLCGGHTRPELGYLPAAA